MAELKEFDNLLSVTIRASRLSGSKVARIAELSQMLVKEDHYLVTTFYKLNASLPPTSQARISSLYVFDAIARACRSSINRGRGKEVSKQRGKGTQAGMLLKLEGIVDSWVNGMIDDGKGGVWTEGKEKTKKIIDIWQKHGTFPQHCIDEIRNKLASTPEGSSTPAISLSGVQAKGIALGVGNAHGSGSTTPPCPPPAHLVTKHRPSSEPQSDSLSSGIFQSTAQEEPRTGELPLEIAKMLGINQSKRKLDEGNEIGLPKTAVPGGIPVDVAAILASVANSQSNLPTSQISPSSSDLAVLPPKPGQMPLPIDPAKLAVLASFAVQTQAAPAQSSPDQGRPPYGHQRQPSQPERGYQRPMRSPRSQGHKPRDRDRALVAESMGLPDRRRRYSDDWKRDGYRTGTGFHGRRRSRSPEHARRDDVRYPSSSKGRPISHTPVSVPLQSQSQPQPQLQQNGRAPPPEWMNETLHAGEDSEEDMALEDSEDEAVNVGNISNKGGPASSASMPANVPFGQRPPFLPPQQQYNTQHPQPPVAANAAISQPSQNLMTLQNFSLQAFNPSLSESWALLGEAWKNTTGKEPEQVELMHWLATRQAMDMTSMGATGLMGNMPDMGQQSMAEGLDAGAAMPGMAMGQLEQMSATNSVPQQGPQGQMSGQMIGVNGHGMEQWDLQRQWGDVNEQGF
ncbi:uncharacterized protein L203_105825 [Cryptococcus depauperatus CBS 7841]|uniref:Uncharacterized protein n=1 Tax=Cryptococcus depauperatus CBS 7841 TaxID=1295531 RepID=A0A1E3I9N1_9TREE|nr:hypothetical protein L203_04974 [Cryptococcus depauperatus CBS 7841]